MFSKKKKEETIESCARRIEKVVPEEVLNKMYIRYHSFDESFPIDPSGKRSITTLINTGVDDKCIALKDVLSKEKSSSKVYVKKKINSKFSFFSLKKIYYMIKYI